ncbi:chaperone NapD [Vibrio hippocampi]|uniref:Chaperone NapD n=1 Tax=Vibrio hippocampi TaxID=654686 RepID=A0ABN8DPK1_9VIBR|nr:chaperone NapD [Vibrio hippocampi]CAH0530171.1 Chaperone NapD [Vibrio hippocampi]
MSLNEVHISSLIVHCKADRLAAVKAEIETFDNAEIYGESEEGKIVVVLETENQGFVTDTIDAINQLPDVLNAALVFHQIEANLEDDEQNITGNNQSHIEGEV